MDKDDQGIQEFMYAALRESEYFIGRKDGKEGSAVAK